MAYPLNLFNPPATADKDKLVTLAYDLLESWSAGAIDEYYDGTTDTWQWNAGEAGADSDKSDWKMGLAALAATVARFKSGLSATTRQRYYKYAVRSVDAWFRDHQDTATGDIFRTSAANVAADSGTATFMGLSNVAIVVQCTGLTSRWASKIAAALDYTTGRGELTYYTNGNFMLYKLLAYELGARVTGSGSRRTDVENLWSFAYYPTVYVNDPTKWRGCGYIAEDGSTGYFSEVTVTSAGIDYTGVNVFDAIYCDAQASFAALGYLLYSDNRYATAASQCTRKMLQIYSTSNNQFTYTGGSRNAGTITRNNANPYMVVGTWMLGQTYLSSYVNNWINHVSNGIDADYRNYLNVTHATFVRSFGLNLCAAIIAAHGVPFS